MLSRLKQRYPWIEGVVRGVGGAKFKLNLYEP